MVKKFFIIICAIFFYFNSLFFISNIQNIQAQAVDLALNKPIVSVSSTAAGSSPANAIDGNPATFWTSSSGGAQWLGIDLGATTSIGTVVIKWGGNTATNYNIELSDDGIGFTVARSGINGDFNSSILGSGRYILIRTISGSNSSNYQLASLEVYAAPIPTPTPTSIATPTPTSTFIPTAILTSTLPPTTTPTPTAFPAAKFVINHQNVNLFSQIPDSDIAQAAALKMMFRHASVGGNISNGLNVLYTQNSKYNRTNWNFQDRGNPGWQAKITDFETQVAIQAVAEDVLSMKLCYVDPDVNWVYLRDHLEALQAAYPNKTFIWWTMPIMTSGDALRDAFNNNLRAYAQTHNIILFDLAAIESHDPAGNAITNNGYEAMYPAYSSDGGHLSALGEQRVAQAFWVMMARISGWSGSVPTPTSTIASTATPTPTPVSCQLTSASWSVPNSQTLIASQNTSVNLNVSGNIACANQQVILNVIRNGISITGGQDVTTQPTAITLNNSGAGSGTWQAEFNPLLPFTDPQYYFTASVTGGNTINNQNSLLTVTGITGGPQISNISNNVSAYPNSQVPKFEKFEATFQINNSVATNLQMPYDANPPAGITPGQGITVNAEFSQDNFQTIYTQPAFYYQDFDYQVKNKSDWIYPNGNYSWKVRFAPTKEGNWQYRLTALDASGSSVSPVQNFTVSANPNNHGFIKVSKTDSRYFEYEDGTYFPALGYNMNSDQISWKNPVLDNQANFQKMNQNGIQLIRSWLSQWSIFGSQDNIWRSTNQGSGYDALIANRAGAVYPGSDTSMEVKWSSDQTVWAGNPCMFLGWMKSTPAIKPNTSYHVSVRYRMPDTLNGPKIAGQPYGLVVKLGGWLAGSFTLPSDWPANYHCAYPAVLATQLNAGYGGGDKAISPYVSTATPTWSTLEADFTADSTAISNGNFLKYFYIAVENINPTVGITNGAYIDNVEVKENLGNGQFGPNIISQSSMSHLQYFDQDYSYRFDKVLDLAKQNNVYLKLVGLEKGEFTQNSFDYNGNPVNYNSSPTGNAYFYGNWSQATKIRWLQQAYWRYLQARWGYSTNIHSWELLNEGDPYSGLHYSLANNFAKYMHQFAPNSHLVTTSNWTDFPLPSFWTNSSYQDLDYADVHKYIFQGLNLGIRVDKPTNGSTVNVGVPADYSDSAVEAYKISMQLGAKQPFGAGKPVMRGETGFVINGCTDCPDPVINNDTNGIWLHKYIWGGINPGGLIESYWYEIAHIYSPQYTGLTFDYRNNFKPYYDFIKDIPLSNGNYQDVSAISSNANLRAWGQKDIVNGKAHLWIDNKNHTWKNVVDKVNIALESGTITIPGMPAGNYTISWFDTYTGNTLKTDTIVVDNTGNVNLPIANLDTDTAFKIERTSVPAACQLTNASWSTLNTTQGTTVNLNVSGDNNCAGKQVSFEVRRNGTLLDDIAANIQPQSASMSATFQASTIWVAERNSLLPFTDPQYYFKASVAGGNTIDTKPQLLTVSGSQTPTPTPTIVPSPTVGPITSPKSMPLISRNLPVYASSGRAIDANDAWYSSFWTATPSAWLAYDISSVAPAQKSKILLSWFNDPLTYSYDDTISATGYNGVPASYVIEANNAVGGGTAPTTGWVALTTIANNPYHSRQHLLDLNGYNWLRMNITGVRDSYGGTQTKINVDLHDASLGLEDDWILYGDSFVAFGLHHGMMGTTGNLSQLINGVNNTYYPLFESAGSNGVSSTNAVAKINSWLSIFPGKYVILAFGSNDALNSIAPSTYFSNMSTLVQTVTNAGKVPIVPKIPWGTASNIQTNAPLLNAEIDKLYTNFPQIVKGPDLWTYFQNNSNLIDSDGIHPTNPIGYVALRQQWVNTILSNIYQITASTPSATPVSSASATPTTAPSPCSISSVSWPAGVTSLTEGSSANISVSATGGCSGKQAHLTVRKNIILQPDADAINQPIPRDVNLILGSGNIATASATWIADAWSNACLIGNCNPSYFAKANIVGETAETTTDRNNDLTITQSIIVPTAPNDWPQVQKDPQRTGYSSETLGTNFKVAWTYAFQPDRVFPQTQAIIYQGKAFVGTEGANGQKPTIYAIDAVTPAAGSNPTKGKVIWKFEAGGPILNSVAAYDNKIFFGSMDGAVYAVDSSTGQQVWKNQLSQDLGFVTAPVVADNKVMLGGQDGNFYALDPNDGHVIWKYNTGAPIFHTAAFNTGADNIGRVFFGTMDMYAYALNTRPSNPNDPATILSWKSQKISGLAFKDYWPVVTQGKVLFNPLVKRENSGIVPGYPFGWWIGSTNATFLTWLSQNGPAIATGAATLVPEIMNAQNTAISNYQANPGNYTHNIYILDETTGQQSTIAPNWNVQSLSGAHTPPCVDRDKKLIVPVMFIGSGWGRLDLSQKRIVDILYDGSGYNGNPLTSLAGPGPAGFGNADENLNVTCTANLILSMHFQEGNANYTGAFNMDTRRWTMINAGMRSNQMSSVLEGRTDPASVSNGMFYHISWHELVARTTN